MNDKSLAAEKKWLKTVGYYRRLQEFGFFESRPIDKYGGLKEVHFSSKNFIFKMGIDVLLCE